jgi:hypothetical protein
MGAAIAIWALPESSDALGYLDIILDGKLDVMFVLAVESGVNYRQGVILLTRIRK